MVDRVLQLALAGPPGEATTWTCRMTAKAVAISLRSVQRIWAVHRLDPHRVHASKHSRNPALVAKLRYVVGLYVHPPAPAVVLAVYEKSQPQALECTQPGLRLKPGGCETMIPERNGTTTLSTARNVLDCTVQGHWMQGHRRRDLRFLNDARRPRWTFHFTPTSCSWFNAVETFFASSASRRVRCGSFRSLVEPEAAINRYLAEVHDDAKPVVGTGDPDQILEKLARARLAAPAEGPGT